MKLKLSNSSLELPKLIPKNSPRVRSYNTFIHYKGIKTYVDTPYPPNSADYFFINPSVNIPSAQDISCGIYELPGII